MHNDTDATRARLARLAELEALTPGWLDGEGAAIDASALRAARALLMALTEIHTALPRIYPTPAGWVQFEWHGSAGLWVEITVTGHEYEIFVVHSEDESTIRESDASTTARAVSELLSAPERLIKTSGVG